MSNNFEAIAFHELNRIHFRFRDKTENYNPLCDLAQFYLINKECSRYDVLIDARRRRYSISPKSILCFSSFLHRMWNGHPPRISIAILAHPPLTWAELKAVTRLFPSGEVRSFETFYEYLQWINENLDTRKNQCV